MTAHNFDQCTKQIKQQISELALHLQFQIADLLQFIVDNGYQCDTYWLERNNATVVATVAIDGIEVKIQETI